MSGPIAQLSAEAFAVVFCFLVVYLSGRWRR